MSITEINLIDEAFPIAGIDQPSDGYRDNFNNIKISLTDLDTAVITEMDDISDVDTTSVAPILNDIFTFDSTNWVPIAFEIVNDITPQLGGLLDLNGFGLGDGTNIIISLVEAATPVNYLAFGNADTGVSPIIASIGTDTDVGLVLKPKNAGKVTISSDDAEADITTDGVLPLLIRPANSLTLRSGGNTSGNGYSTVLRGGDSTGGDGDGGEVIIKPGVFDGSGSQGGVTVRDETDDEIIRFRGTSTGTPVNSILIVNSITTEGPALLTIGDDANVDFLIVPKGTGKLDVSGILYPNTDGTTDGDVMKTDAAGVLSFDAPTDLGEFTVAGLPAAATNADSWALATDASGGRTIVRSDGTAWKVIALESATVVT